MNGIALALLQHNIIIKHCTTFIIYIYIRYIRMYDDVRTWYTPYLHRYLHIHIGHMAIHIYYREIYIFPPQLRLLWLLRVLLSQLLDALAAIAAAAAAAAADDDDDDDEEEEAFSVVE